MYDEKQTNKKSLNALIHQDTIGEQVVQLFGSEVMHEMRWTTY